MIRPKIEIDTAMVLRALAVLPQFGIPDEEPQLMRRALEAALNGERRKGDRRRCEKGPMVPRQESDRRSGNHRD